MSSPICGCAAAGKHSNALAKWSFYVADGCGIFSEGGKPSPFVPGLTERLSITDNRLSADSRSCDKCRC